MNASPSENETHFLSGEQELYASHDLCVRSLCFSDHGVCFVTFASLTDEPTLKRPGFGESFFRDRGVNAIHVLTRTNVWYDYPDFPEALARIAAAARGYDRVISYGSSMGGYAAIRFAGAIGAKAVVAISPQYSVSAHIVPFERRWINLTKPLSGPAIHTVHGSLDLAPVILFDPFDQDKRHAEMICAHYPRTQMVLAPHAGHPAGALLNETGLLANILDAVAADNFDADATTRALRARRRMSSQYLFTLARRLAPHHRVWRRSLAKMAVEQHADAVYLIYEALLCEQAGDLKEAEKGFRAGQALLPDHPIPILSLAAYLLRSGCGAEALVHVERLRMLDPTRPEFAILHLLCLFQSGQYAQSLQLQTLLRAQGINLGKSMRAYIALHRWTGFILPIYERRLARPFSLQSQLDCRDEWKLRRANRRKS